MSNQGLQDFTSDYWERKRVEWAPLCVPKKKETPEPKEHIIYKKDTAIMPSYTGHIPEKLRRLIIYIIKSSIFRKFFLLIIIKFLIKIFFSESEKLTVTVQNSLTKSLKNDFLILIMADVKNYDSCIENINFIKICK